MKKLTRRLLSLLLAVCLVLSMLTGLTLLVSAVGENAIRNWGVRDTVCTQLSSSALSYYSNNNTSYATLKALSGASSTSNSLTAAQNNNLYTALYNLMKNTHDSSAISGITYSSHSTWYAYTDCENGDTSGNMRLFWAGGYRTWDGSYVNREHVWCKSHATYVETNGGADLHHLRPASAYVNQTPHNNKPYGSANAHGGSTCTDENGNFGGWYLNSTTEYSAGQYEPPDNAKGDCARILLYVYTRWKQPNLYSSLDTSSSAYTSFVDETPSGTCDGVACIESLETLLSWCESDPVDTWEMGRNDSVQSIQGNRNVFIDYPELAWYMFGLTPPSTMTTPSGDAASSGVSYAITNVNVNNSAYGTATITNSNTVTVTPSAGCYIQSATSTSGTCTVSGNVITVNGMTANATVTVVLAQNANYTISFTVPAGVTQASMSGYANTSITLPTPTGSPTANAHNYEFLGWVNSSVSDTTALPTYYTAGSSYTITGNATLIALYRYTSNTGSGAVAFDPSGQGGTFVLAANVNGVYYAMPVSGLGGARISGVQITVTDGAVTAANASGYEWTLAKSGSDFTISNGSDTYLTYSGSSTSLASASSAYTWTISANDSTSWLLVPSGGSTRTLSFRAGSYNYFAAYATSNLTSASNTEYYPIEILPIGNGAATQTYYTTNLTSACNHTYGSAVSAGASGHTYTCSICGDTYTEAHNYTTSVSGLTTTYTCTVCGYSYSETLNSYTISYNVLGSVTSTDTITEGNSVSLPTAPAYTGYTFVGWATSAIDPETATVPTTLTGTYTPTASITLYAVYSRLDQGGSSSTEYVLVTDTNQLSAGKNLIIAAKDYDYAMADVYGTYYRNQASVTKSGNTLNPGSGVIPFTLGAGNSSGTWSLYDTTNNAYLTAYLSGSYYDLGTEASVSADGSFTISVASDGTASLTTNNGTCVVKYYRTSSYEEFKCVSSTSTSSYNYDITLYVETPVSSSVTYYTTQPTVSCQHPSTTLTGASTATCTANGYTGDYVCDTCGAVVTAGSVIPALGHDYTSTLTTAATCGTAGVTTYTCSRCGDTYTEAIPATGNHSYGAYVSNNDGTHSQTCSVCGNVLTNTCSYTTTTQGTTVTHVCTDCSYSYTETLSTWTITYVNCNVSSAVTCIEGNSIEFPSCDGVTENGTDYTFVGWVSSRVEETSTRPSTIHTAGESYTPGSSAMFYALYSSSVDGDTVTEFRRVTNASSLAVNDEVIIAAKSYNYGINLSGTTISTGSVSKSSDSTTLTNSGATVFTLVNGSVSGTYGFRNGSYYLGMTSSNYSASLTGSSSTGYPTSWTLGSISSSDGGAVLSAKSSSTGSARYLRYNNGFSLTNRSSSTVALYKKYVTTTQITSYTTELDTHVHEYTGEITTAATCTESGVMTYTCTCGDSYTETIAALGHDYVNHAAQAATCTAIGWSAYQTCSRCDYSTYHEIAALGHDIVTDPAVAATCTEAGLTAGEHCTRCDYAVAQETVPALGHDYTYTDNVDGQTHTVGCARCDYSVTENHAYVSGTCICGAVEVVETLKLVSAAPVLNDKIDMIYAAEVPSGYTDPYVVFTFNGATTTVTEYTTNESGRLCFVFTDINPQCIGDDIDATLYATRAGTVQSVSVTDYSVRAYCVNMLAREIPIPLRTLLSDLLAYGAAAQTYMNYKTNALVNTGDDINNPTYSDYSALTGLGASFEGAAASDVYWTAASLTLTNSVAMNFRFYAESIDSLSVTVTMNGRTQTFTTFTAVRDGIYEVSFTDIQANELGENVTASFARNGSTLGNALTYSVNSYVQSKQNDSNTALQALVKALYNYGAAAAAYES